MEELKVQLDQQFSFNSRKNVLCGDEKSELGFSPATFAYLKEKKNNIRSLGQQDEELLLQYLVTKSMESFCQANQFYHFNSFDKDALKNLYRKLLQTVRELPEEVGDEELQRIAKAHYSALRAWLRRSNPFAKLLYAASGPHLEQEVVCSEYAASTQLDLLGIAVASLQEPILDLGCGSQAMLVKFLRSSGLEAYGIDRNATASEFTYQADWFEFDLGRREWGTVISNVGFSNHFQHHHLRVDGDYTLYAIRFMEILQSLKPGGAFYYAPDLPFIEHHLDAAKYLVQRKAVEGTAYSATRIVKL
jgi:SAM-dependent methyltransferase